MVSEQLTNIQNLSRHAGSCMTRQKHGSIGVNAPNITYMHHAMQYRNTNIKFIPKTMKLTHC